MKFLGLVYICIVWRKQTVQEMISHPVRDADHFLILKVSFCSGIFSEKIQDIFFLNFKGYR